MARYPPNKGLDRWLELMVEQVRVVGAGVTTTGRQLKRYCREAGVDTDRLVCSAGCFSYASAEEVEAWADSWIGRVIKSDFATKAVKGGMATEEELQVLANAWKEWMKSVDAWFATMHGQVLARV